MTLKTGEREIAEEKFYAGKKHIKILNVNDVNIVISKLEQKNKKTKTNIKTKTNSKYLIAI